LVTLGVGNHPWDAAALAAAGEITGGGWLLSRSVETMVEEVGVDEIPDEQYWRNKEYVDPVAVSTYETTV
jgi:hypothetical protein